MSVRSAGFFTACAVLGILATPAAHAGLRVGDFDLGVRGGVVASTISGLAGTASERTYGPTVGLTAGYNINEWIGLESGLVYTEKGGQGPGVDGSGTSTKFVTRLDYVSVPLRIRVPMGPGPVLPYFAVGFEYSFLIAAETWFETDESDKTDAKDFFEDHDFGTAVALGLEIPVSRVILIVEGGWTRGLMDISKVNGLDGKNGTVQLLGGIVVPI